EARGGDSRKLRERLYYLQERAYPDDTIDWSAYADADQFLPLIPPAFLPLRPHAPVQEDTLVRFNVPAPGARWAFVGPLNLDVPYQIYYGARATSGRVTALAWSRSNPQVIYLGSGGGGVWRSNNAGMTWAPTGSDNGDPWTSMQVNCLAVDPTNSE